MRGSSQGGMSEKLASVSRESTRMCKRMTNNGNFMY